MSIPIIGDVEQKMQVWERLDELANEAATNFPLADRQGDELRSDMQLRVRRLIEEETIGLKGIKAVLE